VYNCYKASVPDDKKTLSYNAIINVVSEVFPDSKKDKKRINSQPILCFFSLSLDGEKVAQFHSKELDLINCGQKLNFSIIDTNTICTPTTKSCNGQRVVKEVTIVKDTLSVKIAGKTVFPTFPNVINSNQELANILEIIRSSNICCGFVTDSLSGHDLEEETWGSEADIIVHVRSPSCEGLLPLSYKTTCAKCQEKRNNLLKKRKADSLTNKENLVSLSDVDCSYVPDYCLNPISKRSSTDNANDLQQLRELLKSLAPTLDGTFIELIETQIRNSNVKDKRLRKWDMR